MGEAGLGVKASRLAGGLFELNYGELRETNFCNDEIVHYLMMTFEPVSLNGKVNIQVLVNWILN